MIGTPFVIRTLDRIGISFGTILLNFTITVGCFLIFFAVKYKAFWLMVFSAILIGLGGENLLVAQNSLSEKWFTGKFIGIAIGLNTELAMFGQSLGAWLGP